MHEARKCRLSGAFNRGRPASGHHNAGGKVGGKRRSFGDVIFTRGQLSGLLEPEVMAPFRTHVVVRNSLHARRP
jgi:hypothetical protein